MCCDLLWSLGAARVECCTSNNRIATKPNERMCCAEPSRAVPKPKRARECCLSPHVYTRAHIHMHGACMLTHTHKREAAAAAPTTMMMIFSVGHLMRRSQVRMRFENINGYA